MADAFPWLTNKGKRAIGGLPYKPPAAPVTTAPKAVAAPAPAPAAPAAAPDRKVFEAPATINFGDITDDPLKKKGSMRRTLLAGETGGFNPATGGSTLGGMRSLLG